MKKLVFLIFLFSAKAFPQDGSFSFTLPVAATTSAGVYTPDSILIRTLWSNKTYPAGKNVAKEVSMAETLIADMTTKWNPDTYKDT